MSAPERRLLPSPLGFVHCLIAGPNVAPPIVLLHQTPRSVDEYAEVLPRLAATQLVVAIDTPGYGCSDRLARQPTIAEYAACVTAVLDQLNIRRAVLVGHHTGAIIAVELAASRGERVEGIVLSGPVYTDAATRARLAAVFAQWHVQSDGSHLEEKWSKFARWTADYRIVQRAIVDLLRAGETSEFGHFAVADYRMEDRLGLVRCPTLLIFGLRDPFRFEGSESAFCAALKDCRSLTLDGGVFLPNECPDEFASAILDFLKAHGETHEVADPSLAL